MNSLDRSRGWKKLTFAFLSSLEDRKSFIFNSQSTSNFETVMERSWGRAELTKSKI
jgi:hypothetical protein